MIRQRKDNGDLVELQVVRCRCPERSCCPQWSDDAACPNQEWSPKYKGQPFDAQFHFCEKGWNANGMIVPVGGASTVNEATSADPPEMEIYKLTPMRVGSTKRWVGHALTYAPSPQQSLGEVRCAHYSPYRSQ